MPRQDLPAMLRTQLEPAVADHLGTDAWGLAEADRAVAISQAISLRRIADLLEVVSLDEGEQSILTLPQILLRIARAMERA